jgi:CheY-like chemotaxis protein
MPRPAVLSNVAIVIIEDHADMRFTIGRFLIQHGAEVVATANAFEGLQAVNSVPDVVLSGIRLPDRDGFELLQDLRAPRAKGRRQRASYCNDRDRQDRRSTSRTSCWPSGAFRQAAWYGQLMKAIKLVLKG